ncbi:MAG: hypothetical protein L6Q78_10890 [Bacteroidia bacterium]|nr:hypothetical protein [Bacteroidia bacterium]
MKSLLLTGIFVLLISNFLFAQSTEFNHTVFPKKGLAITCRIVSVTKDSIFFKPDYDSTITYSYSRLGIKGFSYNEKSQEDTSSKAVEIPIQINGLNSISKAGNSIKTAVVFGVIGGGLKAISPFLITSTEEKKTLTVGSSKVEYSEQKSDYTLFAVALAGGIACDIIALFSWYNAGDQLSKHNESKIGLNLAPTGIQIAKRF